MCALGNNIYKEVLETGLVKAELDCDRLARGHSVSHRNLWSYDGPSEMSRIETTLEKQVIGHELPWGRGHDFGQGGSHQ